MPEPRVRRALVVDDEVTGRMFLRALLGRAGYAVETAGSGEAALERFQPGRFDIVFMDMMMPGIDGVEATLAIKERCGDIFVPVIFVTGAGDERTLARAIEAGADDFLAKPVTAGVLLAKLRAMERIHRLHERMRMLYARVIEDQALAREAFDRAVSSRTVQSSALRSRLIPAEVFGGDLLLSARSPEGGLMVLVGDFTGHGLAAALGAMPVAEAFHAMVTQGCAPAAILERLNVRVCDALPRGHFLAACLIRVDPGLTRVTLANCGMPPILLCGAHGVRGRVESASYALGIVRDAPFESAIATLEVRRGERLIVASDGVTEAVNAAGEAFGGRRLEALLRELAAGGAPAPDAVAALLDDFRGATPFADDVGIVEIVIDEALFDAFGASAPGAAPLVEAA